MRRIVHQSIIAAEANENDTNSITKEARATGSSQEDSPDLASKDTIDSISSGIDVLKEILKQHEGDLNFPEVLLEEAKTLLYQAENIGRYTTLSQAKVDHILKEIRILYRQVFDDSPYPEVRSVVPAYDDPTMPCLTVRVWFIGLIFTVFGQSGEHDFRQSCMC